MVENTQILLGAVFFPSVSICTFSPRHMQVKCYLDISASSLKAPTKLQSKGRLNCCPCGCIFSLL